MPAASLPPIRNPEREKDRLFRATATRRWLTALFIDLVHVVSEANRGFSRDSLGFTAGRMLNVFFREARQASREKGEDCPAIRNALIFRLYQLCQSRAGSERLARSEAQSRILATTL